MLRTIVDCQITILQIKNIVSRVRDQINMSTLTVAIRQQCIEEQQAHLKDQFLRFFLRCEGKLKRFGNVEWNRAINSEIRKVVGFQKLESFMDIKLLGGAFATIQRDVYLEDSVKAEEKIFDQFQDLRDMEISEEVKTKTKYFFKWGKFVEEKKAIRNMKNKEIEDLKKAKLFHQYSIKFHNFVYWKQYVKAINLTKKRGILLQQKTKQTIKANVIVHIKQKLEILTIEKLLEEAVGKAIENLKTKSVFKKLQASKNFQKRMSEQNPNKDNIWMQRFFAIIAKRGIPLFSKTSVVLRREMQEKYNRMCCLTAWKGLKRMTQFTVQKMKRVKAGLKKSNLQKFRELSQYCKNTGRFKKDFNIVVKKSWMLSLLRNIKTKQIEENSFELKRKQVKDQFKNVCAGFLVKRLCEMRIFKNDIQSKMNLFWESAEKMAKKHLLSHLASYRDKKAEYMVKEVKTRSSHLLNMFRSRVKGYSEWKKQSGQLKVQLANLHDKKLIKYAWKGLKQVKIMKKNQYQTLTIAINMLQMKIKADAFDIFAERRQSMMKLQRLVNRSEYVILKISFCTILNKMLSKKMKMKNFGTKQEGKLKRMLFDMLLSNSKQINEAKDKAHEVYKKTIKRQFINILKEKITWKQTVSLSEETLENKRKKRLFQLMRQHQVKKTIYEQQQEKVCSFMKGINLSQFICSVDDMKTYQRNQQKKMSKIQRIVTTSTIKLLRFKVKENKNQLNINKQKQRQLQNMGIQFQMGIAASSLQTLIRRSDYVISQKVQKVVKNKFLEIVKYLRLKVSRSNLKRNIRIVRVEDTLNYLDESTKLSKKTKIVKSLILKSWFSSSITTISDNLSVEEDERNKKVMEVQDIVFKGRQRRSKQWLISRTKNHLEMKQNTQLLLNLRVRQGCRQLVKLYLQGKSQNLKEFIALRHYAVNVKRRGMRGLKKVVNLNLLKENRTQTENNSKILVERSIDNARRKSKLIETIERYNMSRVSRVIR